MFGYLRPRGDTKCLNSQVCCLLVCRTCENYTRRWNKSVNMFKFLRRSTTALLVIRHTINDGGWGGGLHLLRDVYGTGFSERKQHKIICYDRYSKKKIYTKCRYFHGKGISRYLPSLPPPPVVEISAYGTKSASSA